jgi:hypothetical protein
MKGFHNSCGRSDRFRSGYWTGRDRADSSPGAEPGGGCLAGSGPKAKPAIAPSKANAATEQDVVEPARGADAAGVDDHGASGGRDQGGYPGAIAGGNSSRQLVDGFADQPAVHTSAKVHRCRDDVARSSATGRTRPLHYGRHLQAESYAGRTDGSVRLVCRSGDA